MKRFLKKLFSSERGSALLLVVLLVMVMMLIVGAVMAMSFSASEVSKAHKEISNLFYSSESSAEKLVDNVNKLVLANIHEIVDKASSEAKNTVFEDENYPLLVYERSDDSEIYVGDYYLLNNEIEKKKHKLLEEKLKRQIYDLLKPEIESGSLGKVEYKINDEGKNYSLISAKLSISEDIANKDDPNPEELNKVVYKLEVTSELRDKDDNVISKEVLEGDIYISDLIGHTEEFREEYKWTDNPDASEGETELVKKYLVPNTFRSPILTFGDLVVTNGAAVTINGDVRAKGYLPPETYNNVFPELEEYGGIYVTHGGTLNVNGDVITLSNVHTIKENESSASNTITINGNVFAKSISIEDDFPYFDSSGNSNDDRLINPKVENQNITINDDVYVDNDIAIDKDACNSSIVIEGNLFGITNSPTGSNPDPNEASGVYTQGEDSKIQIKGNAFVHGQAFVSFDGGKKFSRLYESMGEPYDEVDYLENYMIGDPTGDNSYLTERNDFINKNKIVLDNLGSGYFYAPARVSTAGQFYFTAASMLGVTDALDLRAHSSFNDLSEVANLFNKGEASIDDLLAVNSNWNNCTVLGTNMSAAALISNAYDFLSGDEDKNKFKRNYLGSSTNYNTLTSYRGIQGYMFIKRDAFYKKITPSGVEMMDYDKDILNTIAVTDDTFEDVTGGLGTLDWTIDNPVVICNTSSEGTVDIDVSKFYFDDTEVEPIETIIVDRGKGMITLSASNSSQNKFSGIIISNGQVVFNNTKGHSVTNYNGIIISKGNNFESAKVWTQDLASGACAGIVFEKDVTINYDPNILFKVRCKDRYYTRIVTDYLGLTDYNEDTAGEIISEPNIKIEDIQKVELSNDSVIGIEDTEMYKVMRLELRTLKKKE